MTTLDFTQPTYIDTNGIRMAVYECGEGFPVVFSHGFPELAYSWRLQMPAVAEAGFRAITPDQRGYGLTDRPDNVRDYDIHHLTGDLVGLLDAFDLDKAVFVGHDWGGMVVWNVALLHPDRTAGVVGVNTPFLPRPQTPPIENLRKAFGDSHYIVHFQTPGDADRRLRKDVRRTFEQLMRSGITMKDILSRAQSGTMSMNMCEMVENGIAMGTVALSEDELRFYVDTFERTGFTGGINWYRNMDYNWETTADVPQRVDAPSLMICAENDFALPPALANGMEKYVPDLEKHLIANCGHWTQVEATEELNRLLTDWLTRRFG